MTPAVFLATLRDALRTDLGEDWEVNAADDDWSALEILAGTSPGRFRLVVQAGSLEPIPGGDGTGLVCRQTIACIVQIQRGMGCSAREEADSDLLNAEECVRLHLLSYLFQPPDAPPYTAAELSVGIPAHPEVGQFAFAGSEVYTPEMEDMALKHPARVVRFSHLVALNSPVNQRPVTVPE